MNFMHFHLMMNHLPLIVTVVGLLTLLAALARRSDELLKAALAMFVLSALVAIPTYLTGEQAEVQVQKIAVIAREAVLRHDDAAAWALTANEVLGGLALIGLVVMNRRPAPRWLIVAIIAVAVLVGGAMAYTANLGGKIRHPEVGVTRALSVWA